MKSKKLNIFVVLTFAIVFVLVVASGLTVGEICISGYKMYQQAVEETSIEDRIAEIKLDENYVTLSEMPQSFLDAIVSVEDHRFYQHSGFDIISIVRAAVSNVLNKGTVSGGSTITQQLAKNMYFTFEKTYTRKVAELLVALQLEEKLTKDEILELYANIIYFGNDNFGLGEATVNYFGKEPKDISVEEAVLLAGIPKAPSSFELSAPNQKAIKRANQVIQSMVENNYLNTQEAVLVSNNINSYYGSVQFA